MLAGQRLIKEIVIGDRSRINGDEGIDKLAASIRDHGLINAITIDNNNNLISGYRRIRAVQKLGRKQIACYVVDSIESAELALHMERGETTEQLPMTTVDTVGFVGRLLALSRGDIDFLQRGLKQNAAKLAAEDQKTGRLRETVAPLIGMASSTAGRYIALSRALVSEDPIRRTAGQEAKARLLLGYPISTAVDTMFKHIKEGGGPRDIGPQLNRRLAELALTKFQTRYLLDVQRKSLILGGVVDYFLEKVERVNDDIPDEDRQMWIKQLEGTRLSMSRLLRVLRGERGTE
jgi:hypothetical protein